MGKQVVDEGARLQRTNWQRGRLWTSRTPGHTRLWSPAPQRRAASGRDVDSGGPLGHGGLARRLASPLHSGATSDEQAAKHRGRVGAGGRRCDHDTSL
jgi:hypothetical protein